MAATEPMRWRWLWLRFLRWTGRTVEESLSTNSTPPASNPDRLTIGRLLLLTAGVAVGLGVFVPEARSMGPPDDEEMWLTVVNAVLIGLALPAPLFTVRLRRHRCGPLGSGGLFALTFGVATLSMLPPAMIARTAGGSTTAPVCLYYALPLMGLWFLLAAALGGQIRRTVFSRHAPWSERYGYLLAILWSPLGAWHLVNFYWEVW